jgi:lipopolysaccharide/colanic/teichoic acid biosynthesis glycosyltransferase
MLRIIDKSEGKKVGSIEDSVCDIRIPEKYLRARRYFELGILFVLMPFIMPLFAGIYLALLLTQKSNPIFTQKRMGKDCMPFTIYKFTTMKPSKIAEGVFCYDPSRITCFGHILRKIRLDELPQVINIIKGDMSLIGPRPLPIRYNHICMKEIPYFNCRNTIKPGLTGWGQVSFEHTSDLEGARENLRYDLFYLNNISAGLDIRIFFKTFAVMAQRKGK